MDKSPEHPYRTVLLRLTVLSGGAVGMVLELAGSRLLAPFFGNGLFVWTALIGIMLGFMSLGNFLGGRLADRKLSVEVLFWILVGSAAGIGIISFTEPLVLPALAKTGSIRMAAVVASIALFGIPCTLLGMVTPYTTRYAIRSLAHSGATVGSLYALGTLGSILGTFLGGFYIIAWVGSHDLIAWLAIVPLLLALFFVKRYGVREIAVLVATGVIIALAMTASASALESFDTGYDRYFVDSKIDAASNRPVTILARDHDSMESAVYADNGEPYMFEYYKYYDLALDTAQELGGVERTLLVGGGTFSYPRHQLLRYPSSRTDVVEIDPTLVEVARDRFFLEDDPRLKIVVEDGRTFLNRTTDPSRKDDRRGKYDVVLIDVFKSANSIPYQLTTRETMRMVSDLLDEDGVVVMNIIATPTGPGSRFVSAELKTIKSVFPQANAYEVFENDYSAALNISIIATKGSAREFDLTKTLAEIAPDLTGRQIDPNALPDDVRILTDDFAPVDQYLMDI